MGQHLTLWTIRASLALYAWVVIQLLRRPPGVAAPASADRSLRWLWLASCLLFLIHVGLAFHFYHDWSHQRAFSHTADETERLLGVRVGHGIYCNHLFALIWLADAVLWAAAPAARAEQPRWLRSAVHGYLFFIAFNGAVIFEDGPVRWAGIAVTIALAAILARRRLLHHQPESADASSARSAEAL